MKSFFMFVFHLASILFAHIRRLVYWPFQGLPPCHRPKDGPLFRFVFRCARRTTIKSALREVIAFAQQLISYILFLIEIEYGTDEKKVIAGGCIIPFEDEGSRWVVVCKEV